MSNDTIVLNINIGLIHRHLIQVHIIKNEVNFDNYD